MYHHLNVFLVFGVIFLCQFSDKTLSYTGCPKKIITKIECGGAKFYHERDLGRLDQAQSQQETTQKSIFRHKGCQLLVIEPVHYGSNSILKVLLLGHPVGQCARINYAIYLQSLGNVFKQCSKVLSVCSVVIDFGISASLSAAWSSRKLLSLLGLRQHWCRYIGIDICLRKIHWIPEGKKLGAVQL